MALFQNDNDSGILSPFGLDDNDNDNDNEEEKGQDEDEDNFEDREVSEYSVF